MDAFPLIIVRIIAILQRLVETETGSAGEQPVGDRSAGTHQDDEYDVGDFVSNISFPCQTSDDRSLYGLENSFLIWKCTP